MAEIKKKCSDMEDKIILYIDKELSYNEMCQVESHIHSCPDCRKLYDEYKKIILGSSAVFLSEKKLPEVKVLKQGFISGLVKKVKSYLETPRFVFKMSAAVICFAALCFFYMHNEPLLNSPKFGKIQGNNFNAGNEIKNFSGETEMVEGSLVTTHSERAFFSSSNFNVIFSEMTSANVSANSIKLIRGEIRIDYFKKPATVPFKIQTQNCTVKIIGTKLKVCYNGIETAVAVEEGVISVQKANPKSELILKEGEKILIGPDDNKQGNSLKHKIELTKETEIKNAGKINGGSAAVPSIEPEKVSSTAEIEVIGKSGHHDTRSVEIKKDTGEKLLDYKIDYESMDPKTKQLFFKGLKNNK